jgi:hypothetical protein
MVAFTTVNNDSNAMTADDSSLNNQTKGHRPSHTGIEKLHHADALHTTFCDGVITTGFCFLLLA